MRLARACVVAVLCSVLAATGASAAKLRTQWSLQRFQGGPAGSSVSMSSVNDEGSAVGTLRYANGSSHAIAFYDGHLVDLASKIPGTSFAAGINDRRQVVGWKATNPTASLSDFLANRGDPAAGPHAFFLSGSKLVTLPMPSIANAVNVQGVATGQFRAPDGTLHAFAWNVGPNVPLRKHGHRKAAAAPKRLPAFTDLGPGEGLWIDEDDDVFGDDATHAAWWELSPKTLRYALMDLGYDGTLYGADANAWAAGAQDQPSGQALPILNAVLRHVVTQLGLPASAQASDAIAFGRTQSWIFGTAISLTGQQEALLWNSKLQSVDPESLLPPADRTQVQLLRIRSVDQNGLMTGTADVVNGPLVGFLMIPPPILKLAYLRNLSLYGTRGDKRAFKALGKVASLASKGKRAKACAGLQSIHDYFDVGYDFADSDFEAGYYDEVLSSIHELAFELGCRIHDYSVPLKPTDLG